MTVFIVDGYMNTDDDVMKQPLVVIGVFDSFERACQVRESASKSGYDEVMIKAVILNEVYNH